MSPPGPQPVFLIQFQYIKTLLFLGKLLPNIWWYSSAFNHTFLQENRSDEAHEWSTLDRAFLFLPYGTGSATQPAGPGPQKKSKSGYQEGVLPTCPRAHPARQPAAPGQEGEHPPYYLRNIFSSGGFSVRVSPSRLRAERGLGARARSLRTPRLNRR